jgi:predicted component of type VI protein secretion system
MMERYGDETALLVAQTGPLNGQPWPLRKTTVIGREPDCDIVVPDRQVSRRHARIHITQEGIYLEDLGSKNGTHYNGQRVSELRTLTDGDVIQIALAQKFIFLASDATAPLNESIFDEEQEEATGGLVQAASDEPRRLRLDKRSRRVLVTPAQGPDAGREIEILPPLSVSQFRLLARLYDHEGRVVSRQDLIAAVWRENEAFEISEQALDALVRRLRDRIAGADPSHEYIVTLRGHGLRLENPPL